MLVYICEAHAQDTWPMGWSVEWPRPRSLSERVCYARKCSADLGLDAAPGGANVVGTVDTMDDAFNTAFAAWPTAYYVVAPDGRLLYLGESEPDSAGYNVDGLANFLDKTVYFANGQQAVAAATTPKALVL
eukprot:m.58670 g.58670  ORF g.58670 m.58670 type:complete len:131 (-) comp12892_c0_seq1:32-424(-)